MVLYEYLVVAQPLEGSGWGALDPPPQILLGPLQLFGQLFSWGSNLGGVRGTDK